VDLSDTAPVKAGDVLAGKYRVDRVLGVGGMGVVVAATHMQLDQRVALKFMLPWALQNKMAVERFTRESKACVRLKSEHVARVLDVGELESGSPYMVMEFLEGIDLHDLIHQPNYKVTVEEAVDYVLQVCDAVAEAHAIGIVHRDLKPRNLFLTTGNDGKSVVKVLDFGVSKVTGGADLSLTRTTEIIGSPNYMSPEQLRASRDVDDRSDIWALGCILYELLGGEVPFVAETLTQLTAMVLTEPPRSLSELRADVPFGLVQVISRCLEKDPNKRFPNVAGLATALEKYAPEASKGLAERVRRIADVSRPSMARGVTGDRASRLPGGTGAGGTSVAWAETELAAGVSRKRGLRVALVAGGVVLLVGVAAGGGFYVATRHPHVDPSAAASNGTAVTPPGSGTVASVASSPSAVVTATPSASATAALSGTAPPASQTAPTGIVPATSGSVAGSATGVAGTTRPPGNGRHGGGRVKKDAGSDDMPSDRQ
jgi:tRNA A-37 threonylcarbamoyl transferase component Bud32